MQILHHQISHGAETPFLLAGAFLSIHHHQSHLRAPCRTKRAIPPRIRRRHIDPLAKARITVLRAAIQLAAPLLDLQHGAKPLIPLRRTTARIILGLIRARSAARAAAVRALNRLGVLDAQHGLSGLDEGLEVRAEGVVGGVLAGSLAVFEDSKVDVLQEGGGDLGRILQPMSMV